MIYYCTFCGVPLKPGLRLCSCGQVFGHPVPDYDAQGEPGARYWPPRQPSSAEGLALRAAAWWGSISNRNKAIGGGAVALLLIAIVGTGAHSGRSGSGQNSAGFQTYHDSHPAVTQVPADVPPAAQPTRAYVPQQDTPPAQNIPPPVRITLHPSYHEIGTDDSETNPLLAPLLFVADMDRFDWTDVQIIINPGGGNYFLNTPVIHPNDGGTSAITGYPNPSTMFPVSEFADSAGNRLNSRIKINSVRLICNTPYGPVSWLTTYYD